MERFAISRKRKDGANDERFGVMKRNRYAEDKRPELPNERIRRTVLLTGGPSHLG